MDLAARIGWGIVIYAVAFLAWSGMGIYGWTQGALPYLVELLVLLLVCTWAGSALKFNNWVDILPYSIGWAVIAAALDSLYVVPFQNWGWYQEWSPWIFYLLIVFLPLLAVLLRKNALPRHRPWES